jgi:hypothetical protein
MVRGTPTFSENIFMGGEFIGSFRRIFGCVRV